MTETRAQATEAGPGDDRAPGLRVSGVGKSYGPVRVLSGVDLEVPAGTLTAVLGRSGCGKTTLLRLVAGFARPDEGTIAIAGREVVGRAAAVPPERRGIGYVTQEGNLFPHITVGANITFGLHRRDRRAARRIPELLEMVGLEPALAGRYPHELSGGQQQRVALARALAPGPAIVLLDEPFSSLDVQLRESTRSAVAAALAAGGATTVLVTHDQAEALSLADRVAVMRDGVIVQEDTPARLYRAPSDRRVAEFLGDVVALPAHAAGEHADCALGRLTLTGYHHGPGTVLVRPEQIVLEPDSMGVAAEVLGIDYFGHDGLVRIRLIDSGIPVVARCPAHLLPEVGDQVLLKVRGPVALDQESVHRPAGCDR